MFMFMQIILTYTTNPDVTLHSRAFSPKILSITADICCIHCLDIKSTETQQTPPTQPTESCPRRMSQPVDMGLFQGTDSPLMTPQ